MTNTEWVLTLKVGDLVAIDAGRSDILWYLRKIEEVKVPKPARKRLAKEVVRIDGTWYDENGEHRGSGSGTWDAIQSIEPVTETIRAVVKRRRIIEKLKAMDWAALDTETLEEIAAVLL